MDPTRFDRFAIVVGQRTTRRKVLALLAALGLTGLGREEALAICLVNGTRCDSGTVCCSGWCKRKRGTNKKFCRRAPGQGICTISSNQCAPGGVVTGCAEGGSLDCQCFVTSRGYSLCAVSPASCFACETNRSCEQRLGGSPGDQCVQCTNCGSATNNRACASRCPNRA